MADRALEASSLERLLGLEGNGARLHFGAFAGMLKRDQDGPLCSSTGEFAFDFTARNRRPPRDAVNALLSLAYGILAKDSDDRGQRGWIRSDDGVLSPAAIWPASAGARSNGAFSAIDRGLSGAKRHQ